MENLREKLIEIHDRDCPDRTCEPTHFAGQYLAQALAELLAPECLNKHGKHKDSYATWEAAENGCYEMREKSAYPVLFAYLAPCGRYHIGHQKLSPPR